jgi:hypothetical protein
MAGLFAYRAWGHLRADRDGTSLHRAQAFAIAGMASSVVYLLIILFGFVASFLLHGSCTRSL